MFENEDFLGLGSRWGRKFYFLAQLLKEVDGSGKLNDILVRIIKHSWGSVNENDFKAKLAEVGRYFKIMGEHNKYVPNENYIYFINLEMLGDYADPSVTEVDQGLADWLLISKEILIKEKFPKIYNLYYQYFDIGLKMFFKQEKEYNKERDILFRDYINEIDLWATAGSAGSESKLIGIKELNNRFVNTKKSIGVLIDKDVLYKHIMERKKQTLKVNIKRELVKSRGVVNSDMDTYLLMSYISYLCEGTLYGSTKTNLFMKSKYDRIQFIDSVRKNIRGINVPLDQSTFDANVDHIMVKKCFDCFKEYCGTYNNENNDVNSVLDKLNDLIVTGDVIISKNKKAEFKHGIPSGWRWTGIFDSAINYAQLIAAQGILREIGETVDIINITVQGDDVQCNINSQHAAECVIALNDLLGLKINRKKMFVEQDRTEYLRQVYTYKGSINDENCISIEGYPVRALPTLFNKAPGTTDFLTLNSLLDMWGKIRRRFRLFNNVYMFELEVKDVVNFMNYANRKTKCAKIKRDDCIRYIFGKLDDKCYGEKNDILEKHYEEIIKGSSDILTVSVESKLNDEVAALIKKHMITIEKRNMHIIENKKDIEYYLKHQMQWHGIVTHTKYIIQKVKVRKKLCKGLRLVSYVQGKDSRLSKFLDAKNKNQGTNIRSTALYMMKISTATGNSYRKLMTNTQMYDFLKQKSDGNGEKNKYNGCTVIKNDNYYKWCASSIGFRNKILLANDGLLRFDKNIQGVVLNNLVCSQNIITTINVFLSIFRWTSNLVKKIFDTSSSIQSDNTIVTSTE